MQDHARGERDDSAPTPTSDQTPSTRSGPQHRGPLVPRRTLITGAIAFAAVLAVQGLGAPIARAATGARIPLREFYGNGYFGKPSDYGPHRGIDLAPPSGQRPAVRAAAPGIVSNVFGDGTGNDGAPFGNYVELYHGTDGAGHHWHTRYHMLSGAGLPQPEQQISQDQIIGYVGDQHVINSTGPHLHFETCTSGPANSGNVYSNRYAEGDRRCVDPFAHIDSVPTNNFNPQPEPEPDPQEQDMLIYAKAGASIGIFGGGWSYSFQNTEEHNLWLAMVRNSGYTLPPRLDIAVRAYELLERASKGNA